MAMEIKTIEFNLIKDISVYRKIKIWDNDMPLLLRVAPRENLDLGKITKSMASKIIEYQQIINFRHQGGNLYALEDTEDLKYFKDEIEYQRLEKQCQK